MIRYLLCLHCLPDGDPRLYFCNPHLGNCRAAYITRPIPTHYEGPALVIAIDKELAERFGHVPHYHLIDYPST